MTLQGRRVRVLAFVGVLGLLVLTVTAVVADAVRDSRAAQRPTAATASDLALAVPDVRAEPHVVFRSTAPGPTYGRLAAVPLRDPDGPRAVGEVECERVYADRRQGVCLTADRGVVTTYAATLLDAELRPGRSWPLGGAPSRTRLSADGRWVATTSFVTGHSYAGNDFSTETVVSEVATGRAVGNLERFAVTIEGQQTSPVDLNVWGVTFDRARSDRFFATVATGGRVWLAEGDLRERTLRTLREGVECPSLSPDGRRVAFKARQGPPGAPLWRIHVLDLASGREWAVTETRTVDDQVEWLDDHRLLYGLPRDSGGGATDVWLVPAEGGEPAVFIPWAWSPAVVR